LLNTHHKKEYHFDKFSLKVLPLVYSVESYAFYIKEYDTPNRLGAEKLKALQLEPSPLYGELKRGKSIVVNREKIHPELFILEPKIGRRVIIAGDNDTPQILGSYLDGIDLLLHECTYLQKTYDTLSVKVLYTTARDLGICAEKQRIRNLIATHIDPRYITNRRSGLKQSTQR